jgi:hypothetical protein
MLDRTSHSAFDPAMTWFVDVRAGSDANDGKSAGKAFASLQRAMQGAKSGDTIQLAPGLYDLDLEKRVREARGRGIVVVVAGSH